jgi:hypothetical protein
MFAYDVLHKQGKVIPCKDCKYFFGELGGDYGSCTRIQGGDVVKATDFCSRAKRKDGVNNDKKTSD